MPVKKQGKFSLFDCYINVSIFVVVLPDTEAR